MHNGESAGINPFDLESDIKGNKPFLNILDKVAEIRALLSTIARNYQARTLYWSLLAINLFISL